MDIPTVTLHNGVEIPQVGLGVFQVPEDGTQRIVIPKSVTPERYRANLAAVDLELTDTDRAAIDALENGSRLGADPAVAAFTQYRD
nr:hypothetical protein [Sanguibacter massiliensis]